MKAITIPLHINDFIADTRHLSAEELGAYMRLLMCHYQTGKDGLPNDESRLARMAGMDVRSWRRVEGQVRGFFVWDAHAGRQKRVCDVLTSIEEKSKKARANALKLPISGQADAKRTH